MNILSIYVSYIKKIVCSKKGELVNLVILITKFTISDSMFYINKEDKFLDKDFCDGFIHKIITTFNGPNYKNIIDKNFLEYIKKPGAITLFKNLSYSIEGDYKCDVTFEIKKEQKYVVSDGYESKTEGRATPQYNATGPNYVKVESKTTYTEKSHVETNTNYSKCVRSYSKHFYFDNKGDYRISSSAEFGEIDSDYKHNIFMEILDNSISFQNLEKYDNEVKKVKHEYEQKVSSDVKVTVKAKKVNVTNPSIDKVNVYADYNYYAKILYNGKEYIYTISNIENEDFPLNPDAEKKVKTSKRIYKVQKVIAFLMGIITLLAVIVVILFGIFFKIKGDIKFLTFIKFPFLIVDIVLVIIYLPVFTAFLEELDDIIKSNAGKHMLNRKDNRKHTAISEVIYYVVAFGSLALAIFQIICVINAFMIALSYS